MSSLASMKFMKKHLNNNFFLLCNSVFGKIKTKLTCILVLFSSLASTDTLPQRLNLNFQNPTASLHPSNLFTLLLCVFHFLHEIFYRNILFKNLSMKKLLENNK